MTPKARGQIRSADEGADAPAPSTSAQIDELPQIERWIISLLQDDGRMSFNGIAQRIGLSETSARRQVQRLIRDGTIAITAVANPRLLGLEAMAWIGVTVNWARAENLQSSLLEIRGIDYVATTSGRFQILAEIGATDTSDLSSRIDLVRAVPGVTSTETFPYLDLFHQEFRWLGPNNPNEGHLERASVVRSLSDLDRQLILELRRDGRQSFRQIASSVDAPEHQVRARYARLVDAGVLRVMAVLNPARLGIDTMASLGIRVEPATPVREVARAVSDLRGVDYVVICIGRYDIMAEVMSRSREDLAHMVEHDLGRIDGIASNELLQYLRLQYRDESVWSVGRVSAVEG